MRLRSDLRRYRYRSTLVDRSAGARRRRIGEALRDAIDPCLSRERGRA